MRFSPYRQNMYIKLSGFLQTRITFFVVEEVLRQGGLFLNGALAPLKRGLAFCSVGTPL